MAKMLIKITIEILLCLIYTVGVIVITSLIVKYFQNDYKQILTTILGTLYVLLLIFGIKVKIFKRIPKLLKGENNE